MRGCWISWETPDVEEAEVDSGHGQKDSEVAGSARPVVDVSGLLELVVGAVVVGLVEDFVSRGQTACGYEHH